MNATVVLVMFIFVDRPGIFQVLHQALHVVFWLDFNNHRILQVISPVGKTKNSQTTHTLCIYFLIDIEQYIFGRCEHIKKSCDVYQFYVVK